MISDKYSETIKLSELADIDISSVKNLNIINIKNFKKFVRLVSDEIKVSNKEDIDISVIVFIHTISSDKMAGWNGESVELFNFYVNGNGNMLFNHFDEESYNLQCNLETFNNCPESILCNIVSKPFGVNKLPKFTGSYFIDYSSYMLLKRILFKMKEILQFEDDFYYLFESITPVFKNLQYKSYDITLNFIDTRFNITIRNQFENNEINFSFDSSNVILKLGKSNVVAFDIEEFLSMDNKKITTFIETLLSVTNISKLSFNKILQTIKLESILTY